MVRKGQTAQGGLIGRARRRGRKISGRHEGPVRSGGRVTVEGGAVVLGDVMAPQVVVKGLIRGRVVSGTLTVEDGGEVWGDAWAESVRQKPGGMLRGWISPLTLALREALESDGPMPPELELGPAVETDSPSHDPGLQALRAELVEALLARKDAERRLAEHTLRATSGDETETGEGERVLAAALLQAQDRAGSLERQVSDLEEALSQMTNRRDTAVALGVERQGTIDALTAELERRQGRIARLIDDLTSANQASGERQREIDRLAIEAAQAQDHVDALNEQLMATREQVRQRERVLDDLGDNLVQSQGHVEQQHMELISLRDQLEAVTQQNVGLRAGAEEAQAAQRSAEEALRRQEAEILRVRTELDAVRAESDQDHAALAGMNRRSEDQDRVIASLRGRLAEEAGAQRELEQIQGRLDEAHRLAEAQRALAESRGKALADLQVGYDRLNRRQGALEVELLAAGEQTVSLGDAQSTAQERIAELEGELKASRQQVAAQQKDWELKTAQVRQLLAAAREQMGRLRAETQQHRSSDAQAQGQMAAWRAEVERLGRELALSMEKNEVLGTELSLARSIIAELNGEIAGLQDRLDERDRTVARLYAELSGTQPQGSAGRPDSPGQGR
jgi:chemotaxis protein MotB